MVARQRPLAGFADQGEVVIKARQASDALGATKMDRPEWLAIDAARAGSTAPSPTTRAAASRLPGVDAANPRANNVMGQIIRWKEDGDFDGETFDGTTSSSPATRPTSAPRPRATSRATSSPVPTASLRRARHALGADRHGPTAMNRGELARIGNNQMLACDVATGEMRRFLVGPVNCEITGATWTPDGARCSSTSSIRARRRASAATRPSRASSATGRLQPGWPAAQRDGGDPQARRRV
jgi:secreted PhoX family phosphatase